MSLNALKAISPVDGRYYAQTQSLSEYFSELALMRYRIWVEVEYFIALSDIPLPPLANLDRALIARLRQIHRDFSESDALRIKEIEKVTNHDVKAIEYFLREKMDGLNAGAFSGFIHFGLTSQDINNTAIPASFRDAMEKEYIPAVDRVIERLIDRSRLWKDVAMLARTHGQPASPTRLGKELYVFVERLDEQLNRLEEIPVSAKFGGATGNFNAHHVAYPHVDWVEFANDFLHDKLHLSRSLFTTQIEHYDNLAATFDALKRTNTILIDLCRDMWTYISMDYFRQETNPGEIGSSAMPHKVNPIDFENAEGNLGLANALFEHLSAKLPVSRLQRDLTDSTVLRNIGVPLAHTLIALQSIEKGLDRLQIYPDAISEDLSSNWMVIAEALQTILRREAYPDPYETLLGLTKGRRGIGKTELHEFIEGLDIPEAVKQEMKQVTPFNYTGIDLLGSEF